MKRVGWVLALLLAAGLVVWLEPTGIVRGRLTGRPFAAGRPSDYWARALVDVDPLNQKKALAVLSDEGNNPLPVLLDLLEHPDAKVRWHAAELAGRHGEAAA